ncbi:MAG TPA: PAS domain-containing sensor histidine kinase, partial [Candidatus Wallbacteria bacterium]|nr:PAS domain-containing sensor histidine kinase [Candidatus Wallbacteria bacterium]
RNIYLRYKVKPVYDESGKITGAITVVEDITGRKKIETALIESEVRFKNIIQSSPIGIIILNETCDIEYSNPAFCELYGYSSDELIGKNIDIFLFEKDRNMIHIEFNKYISGIEYAMPDELETKTRNGKTLVIMSSRVKIKESSGKIKSVTFISDITGRKKTEQKLTLLNEFYLSLFENFPAMIWRSGEDAKCNYVNKTWLEYTGMTIGQCIGDGWLESVHPNDLGTFTSNYINCFNEKKTFEIQYRLKRYDGEYHWVANVGNPFIDINGTFSGFIGACFDITEQKKYEEQIKHLNENLERKVRERTRQLEAVNSELNATKEKLDEAFKKEKELNQIKTQFISTVSHDFRTPLSVILSSTELLEFYSDRLDEEKKKEHLHRIQDTVTRMTNLLDDVLFINRVDSERIKLNFVSINVVGLCSNICDEMRMVAGKKASVHFSSNMIEYNVLADEKILRHILLNLIANAVKYSPEGGEVDVKIDISSGDGIVSYTISDHGIGIPEEEQKKLFEPFHRASNVGNIQGTGLGLSIVKRCVDLCGGTIELKSRPGEGTVFTVKMP